MTSTYDNDNDTLEREKSMFGALLLKVNSELKIIGVVDNASERNADSDDDEEDLDDFINYFVLTKESVAYEEKLKEMLATETNKSPRYSIVKRNHPFIVRHGNEHQYETDEMTLVIARIAFRLDIKGTSQKGRKVSLVKLLWKFSLLLIVIYAGLQLWRLIESEKK